MARAGTVRAATAKVKSTASEPGGPKKTTAGTSVSAQKVTEPAPKNKPNKKKASAKQSAAPKMTSAPKRTAPQLKKAAAKGQAAASRSKTAAKVAAPPTRPAVGKVAQVKAAAAKPPASKPATGTKSAVKTKPAAKTKAAAKTVAVKQATPRRPNTRIAVPAPAARRGRSIPPARKNPAAVVTTTARLSGSPQVFTVSHLNEADFKADGLRPYARYRDLGIAAATGGLCQAHVIRMVPPCTDEVRKRHVHQTELQLIYVLKGWMKNEFEGHGEQMMSTGSCWLQPSGIKHTVLDYSPDCEVLEIIVPADFKTEDIG